MTTSYSRRQGAYSYDVEVHEAAPPGNVGRYYARVVNMVRLESGHQVTVNADLRGEYGATPDEAFSRLEAAVAAWVKARTQKS
jgi:hypothetical protein